MFGTWSRCDRANGSRLFLPSYSLNSRSFIADTIASLITATYPVGSSIRNIQAVETTSIRSTMRWKSCTSISFMALAMTVIHEGTPVSQPEMTKEYDNRIPLRYSWNISFLCVSLAVENTDESSLKDVIVAAVQCNSVMLYTCSSCRRGWEWAEESFLILSAMSS